MKTLNKSFLNCCEWLYRSASAAGILYIVYGLTQRELTGLPFFAEVKNIPLLAGCCVPAAQLLLYAFAEGRYRLWIVLGAALANLTAVLELAGEPEKRLVLFGCLGFEAAVLAASAFVYCIRRQRALRAVTVLAELIALVYFAVREIHLPAWCIAVILSSVLLYLAELTAKGKREVYELLPLFLLFLLPAGAAAGNEKPFDWTWAVNAGEHIAEKAKMCAVDLSYLFAGENVFSYSFGGYTQEGGLGGVILDNENVQLYVNGATKNPLYLTGAVYDEYTGSGWKKSNAAQEEKPLRTAADALEQSVYREEKERLLTDSYARVKYGYIKTTAFFHDLNTNGVSFHAGEPKFEKDSRWTMTKPRKKDFEYQIRFTEINENAEEIRQLFRGRAWRTDAVFPEAVKEYEKTVHENETKLPDTLPERVRELAASVCRGMDNDYDRMRALSLYLSDYTYTTAPAECPAGHDFVDYFLFESREGYCTYFATALAVLGRCEGIPVRYVQGFVTSETCTKPYKNTAVTGNNAHAWTEAYIDGIGWVRFDATPGYGTVTADLWAEKEAGTAPESSKPAMSENIITGNREPDIAKKRNVWTENLLPAMRRLCFSFLGMAAAAAVVCIMRRLWRQLRYQRMDMSGKLRAQMERLLRIGKRKGVPYRAPETLAAYGERLAGLLDTESFSFAEARTLYEAARFGGKKVSGEELKKLEMYTKECGKINNIIDKMIEILYNFTKTLQLQYRR